MHPSYNCSCMCHLAIGFRCNQEEKSSKIRRHRRESVLTTADILLIVILRPLGKPRGVFVYGLFFLEMNPGPGQYPIVPLFHYGYSLVMPIELLSTGIKSMSVLSQVFLYHLIRLALYNPSLVSILYRYRLEQVPFRPASMDHGSL